MHNSIIQILGVQVILGICKYLGLSSMIGRSMQANIGYIKDWI